MTKGPLLRHSQLDAALVALALLQGVALVPLLATPSAARPAAATALAVGLWWNSNTISHNHLHNAFFRPRWLNQLFSLYLSLLLGVPQTLWRSRHLWHHAGEPTVPRPRPRGARGLQGLAEVLLIGLLWLALLALVPAFFLSIYLPGYLLGLVLCHLQGHYEHAGALGRDLRGVSYYGSFYNRIWFNDGHHAEHHLHPREHWSRLPTRRLDAPGSAVSSPLPPVLRWLTNARLAQTMVAAALGWLERLALRKGPIQRFMLRSHERAFAAILPRLGDRPLVRIAIVGGGLFPRSARVLARLLPQAELCLLEKDAGHLTLARVHLEQQGADLERVRFVCARYDPAQHQDFDLVVVPLAYLGDREALYRPDGPPRLVHDWIWRRGGRASVAISFLLLKRLNLVLPCA